MAHAKRRNAGNWRSRIHRAEPPEMKNTMAAILGGGGGALVGGFLANRGWNPEMVALAMTVGGGVGAYTLGGNFRTAATGLAAAGAGQLALSLLARSAEKDGEKLAAGERKPANAQLPAGRIEEAFEQVRRRFAAQRDDEERYSDAIDADGEEMEKKAG